MAAYSIVAHAKNMVSQFLMVLALAAAAPVEPRSGAQIEIRVSATIQRGVTVRAQQVATDISVLTTAMRPDRTCDAAPAQQSDCRLIVYDLP